MSGGEIVKHQHMVPKLYLRFFCQNETTLNVFDKIDLKIYQGNIKTVGSERYFYDSIPGESGDEYQRIEKEVNPEYEGSVSIFLKDFIRQVHSIEHFTLKLHHKEVLAKHMAYQHIRTRKFREESIRSGTGIELYEPVTFGLDPDVMHLGVLMYNSHYVEQLKRNMIDNYYWVIGVNQTEEKFYTSDHPVAQRETMNSVAVNTGSLDLLNLSVQISFPLSPDIVLMLFQKQEGQKQHRDKRLLRNKRIPILDLHTVHSLNELQIESAYRQVYSIDGNYDFVKRAEAERREKLIAMGHDPAKFLLPEWLKDEQPKTNKS